MKARPSSWILRGAASLLTALVLAAAAREVFAVASVTGDWRGGFSINWALIFAAFCLAALAALACVWIALWRSARLRPVAVRVVALRARLGRSRFILAALLIILPLWWLQFTY